MAENFESDETKAPELKLDPKQALGFIRFFRRLSEDTDQDSQVIRFFDRKDYHTAHGDNATFIAKTYYRTLTAVKQLCTPQETLSSLAVNHSSFEGILRDLLLHRTDHTVELYEGSGSTWRLTKKATPGRLGPFEDVLFATNEMQDSPVMMAVLPASVEGQNLVGMAFVDLTKRAIGMTEFLDDEQYTNLESAIVALGCRECILPHEGTRTPEGRRLRDVMLRCNVLATEKKRAEFRGKDVERDLGRLLRGTDSDQGQATVEVRSETVGGALAALLSYTELLSDDTNFGQFSDLIYSLGTHMRLDAAALRALNVLESKTDANKNFSLFGLMNRTCTAGMGKRLLNRWLKQPLVDVEEIRGRHDVVQAFADASDSRQDLRTHLKRVPDIERLVRKLERKKATLVDIVKLYQGSSRLPFIKECLQRHQGELNPKYADALETWCGRDHLGRFEALVEAAVDLDRLEEGEYLISPTYDPSLQDIQGERDVVEDQVRKVHETAAADLGLSSEKALKLEKSTQHGYVFRMTKKEETAVRKKLTSAYVTLETRKDGIKFTNAKLRRLSEAYTKLSDEYSSVQRDLVTKVVEVAATFAEVFVGVANMVAELDVLVSFADLAVCAPSPYVRPTMTSSDEGELILEGSRHPCVEVQDDVSFIPNDCVMERASSWFQIITGPNMGGKSTFIRQVGVCVLMAQVGSFVPCDRAQISVRDCIFARVGAGDCQLRGVSTFMSEMLETAAILHAATHRALVIIDELGRGTSTYDGFGLAWAICEHLVTRTRAPTLFATHFHELTALAGAELPGGGGEGAAAPVGISNRHVSAHIDEASRKLTMLYKVEEGPCDQSFGIHVAEFANFPEEVVSLARRKAAELEDFAPPRRGAGEEAGEKRKRDSSSEEAMSGSARARQFLRDFAALPLDTMDSREAAQRVGQLKKKFEEDAVTNPWLQKFVPVH